MGKNIDDMIVPERTKSIRNIPIPESRRRNMSDMPLPNPRQSAMPPAMHNEYDIPEETKRSPRVRRKGIWISSIVGFLVVLFAILSFMNKGTLSYIPRSVQLEFDNNIYTANKSGEEALLFSVVKFSLDKGVSVPATGSVAVNRKASGQIVVYNEASTEPQRLLENTRFQTPGGLVYRVQSAISVPGKKTVNGVSQPGSLEVTVYADEPGEKHNIGLSDFTLPGLAGSAKFTTVYARSKTPMTGGFEGMEKAISLEDRAKAETELKESLGVALETEGLSQVPENFVLIPAFSHTTFEELPQTEASDGNVMLNMRGNYLGIMFKNTDLANELAKDKTRIGVNELIDIDGLSALNFSLVDVVPEELSGVDEIKFSVTGSALAVWRTDEVALKTDLSGRRKKDIANVLTNYPTVVSATANVRPFWKTSFPESVDRILIKKLPVR